MKRLAVIAALLALAAIAAELVAGGDGKDARAEHSDERPRSRGRVERRRRER